MKSSTIPWKNSLTRPQSCLLLIPSTFMCLGATSPRGAYSQCPNRMVARSMPVPSLGLDIEDEAKSPPAQPPPDSQSQPGHPELFTMIMERMDSMNQILRDHSSALDSLMAAPGRYIQPYSISNKLWKPTQLLLFKVSV